MRLILLIPFILFGSVQAQCTKDTDCKGERICEKQVCVAPTTLTPLPLDRGVLPSGVHPGDTTKDKTDVIGLAYQDQLTCATDPEPGKALKALRTLGYIGKKPKSVIDGIAVYSVIKPFSVFGFRVLEVTGWEENGDASLFWRGPGTAPPLHIQALVEGAPALVKAEVLKRAVAGKSPSVNKGNISGNSKQTTEITCYGK